MKYIFLDFDGVISWTLKCRKTAVENNRPQSDELDPDCLNILKEILSLDNEIVIIISSAWRHCKAHRTVEGFKQMFTDWGFPEIAQRVIGLTPNCGIARYRQHEIDQWLRDNNLRVDKNWCAIDDCNDIIAARLVQTNMDLGLQDHHVMEVISTLNNKREYITMRDPNIDKAREVLHALIDEKREERRNG